MAQTSRDAPGNTRLNDTLDRYLASYSARHASTAQGRPLILRLDAPEGLIGRQFQLFELALVEVPDLRLQR